MKNGRIRLRARTPALQGVGGGPTATNGKGDLWRREKAHPRPNNQGDTVDERMDILAWPLCRATNLCQPEGTFANNFGAP
jgi:hypothetical protein